MMKNKNNNDLNNLNQKSNSDEDNNDVHNSITNSNDLGKDFSEQREIIDEEKLILNHFEIDRIQLVTSPSIISPTLQCSICLDLVFNPVQCRNCSKLFCKNCIEMWLEKQKECPNKHPFAKKECDENWIKKALGEIILKCPYYGCTSYYEYNYWIDHIRKCTFKLRGFRKIENKHITFEYDIVQIFVKDIRNKTHTFELPLNTTILELKEKLVEKTGLKVNAQRLIVNGKPLEDSKTLEYYGIKLNQTILQLARLLGG